MRKVCNTCNQEKLLGDFRAYSRIDKNGMMLIQYANKCKRCTYDLAKKRREDNLDFIYDYLSDHPCVHCGCTDLFSLEFDHIDPSLKSYKVSDMSKMSLDKIKEEIGKCQILCSSCHKKKTAKDQNYYLLTYIEKNSIK